MGSSRGVVSSYFMCYHLLLSASQGIVVGLLRGYLARPLVFSDASADEWHIGMAHYGIYDGTMPKLHVHYK